LLFPEVRALSPEEVAGGPWALPVLSKESDRGGAPMESPASRRMPPDAAPLAGAARSAALAQRARMVVSSALPACPESAPALGPRAEDESGQDVNARRPAPALPPRGPPVAPPRRFPPRRFLRAPLRRSPPAGRQRFAAAPALPSSPDPRLPPRCHPWSIPRAPRAAPALPRHRRQSACAPDPQRRRQASWNASSSRRPRARGARRVFSEV